MTLQDQIALLQAKLVNRVTPAPQPTVEQRTATYNGGQQVGTPTQDQTDAQAQALQSLATIYRAPHTLPSAAATHNGITAAPPPPQLYYQPLPTVTRDTDVGAPPPPAAPTPIPGNPNFLQDPSNPNVFTPIGGFGGAQADGATGGLLRAKMSKAGERTGALFMATGGGVGQTVLQGQGVDGPNPIGLSAGGVDNNLYANAPTAQAPPPPSAQPAGFDSAAGNFAKNYGGSQALDALGAGGYGGGIMALTQGKTGIENYAEGQAIQGGLSAAGADSAVPYAGSILSAAKGNYKGAAGSAIGTAVGSIFGPIGSAVGSFVGGYVGNSCFITQAVAAAFGAGDEHPVLQKLRAFRDNFMLKDPRLAPLVQEYYRIAPIVVAAIDKLPQAKDIYRQIGMRYIGPAIQAIDKGDMQGALRIYAAMVQFAEQYASQAPMPPQAHELMDRLGSDAGAVAQGGLEQVNQMNQGA